MNLKGLLLDKNIDPQHVLVLRHRPLEAELNKVLPWLAAERPDVFNAYQQTQTKQVEQEMKRAAYVAAFIGHEPGKALFVGLYSVKGWKPITPKEYWQIPANVELKSFGHKGFTKKSSRSSILWFDLAPTDFYDHWKGKLIICWPPLDKNWHRWAHRPKNEMPVHAILEESVLDAAMPEWDAIDLTWDQLRVLPARWKSRLSEWRGVYYIFDTSDGKGYVGSAYGESNLLGRWLTYAAHGHGDNRLLRERNPRKFRFTILQRVSPDMKTPEMIELESSWKRRLHTREYGLNDN
ncbi:MAG TPA: GIY-YIG nuclease family protein [candidate division Zixibacteria bacterium]|nr:GIY-YIG nuclease family protein [candidate division Zixibacteria bacterium]